MTRLLDKYTNCVLSVYRKIEEEVTKMGKYFGKESNSSSQKTIKQLMDEAKERNDILYEEYLKGNNDYRLLADKYGLTYDNVKKIIYRRNKKGENKK